MPSVDIYHTPCDQGGGLSVPYVTWKGNWRQ